MKYQIVKINHENALLFEKITAFHYRPIIWTIHANTETEFCVWGALQENKAVSIIFIQQQPGSIIARIDNIYTAGFTAEILPGLLDAVTGYFQREYNTNRIYFA